MACWKGGDLTKSWNSSPAFMSPLPLQRYKAKEVTTSTAQTEEKAGGRTNQRIRGRRL
jgi:hypothetical protein